MCAGSRDTGAESALRITVAEACSSALLTEAEEEVEAVEIATSAENLDIGHENVGSHSSSVLRTRVVEDEAEVEAEVHAMSVVSPDTGLVNVLSKEEVELVEEASKVDSKVEEEVEAVAVAHAIHVVSKDIGQESARRIMVEEACSSAFRTVEEVEVEEVDVETAINVANPDIGPESALETAAVGRDSSSRVVSNSRETGRD
jgi:hypothetical protein